MCCMVVGVYYYRIRIVRDLFRLMVFEGFTWRRDGIVFVNGYLVDNFGSVIKRVFSGGYDLIIRIMVLYYG